MSSTAPDPCNDFLVAPKKPKKMKKRDQMVPNDQPEMKETKVTKKCKSKGVGAGVKCADTSVCEKPLASKAPESKLGGEECPKSCRTRVKGKNAQELHENDIMDEQNEKKAALKADRLAKKEAQKTKRKAKLEEVKASRQAKIEEIKESKKAIAAKAAPSKRRGLSLEEKCCRFEQHMAKFEEILTLKELEKIGPTIGVIPQAVKDVITCLIKERRIKCEKVGASNIYWLFKRDLAESRLKEKAKLQSEIHRLNQSMAALMKSLASAEDEQADIYGRLPAGELNKRIRDLRIELLELRHKRYIRAIYPAHYKTASDAAHQLAHSWANEYDWQDA